MNVCCKQCALNIASEAQYLTKSIIFNRAVVGCGQASCSMLRPYWASNTLIQAWPTALKTFEKNKQRLF